jgi:hypothetical protein
MSREARLIEPAPLEARLREPAPTPVRKFDPWTNRWSYSTAEAEAHGSEHSPQQKLTQTARGEYGGDEPPGELSDEDKSDLDKIHRILRKKPHLRAHTNPPVEAYRSPEYAALLREIDGLYADLGQLPMGVHEAEYHQALEEAADTFVGKKLEKGQADKATRKQRQAARAVFGLGRREMIERGLLPARDGWC